MGEKIPFPPLHSSPHFDSIVICSIDSVNFLVVAQSLRWLSMEKGNWSNCVTRYYYNHRYFTAVTAVTAVVVVVVIVVDCPGCWKLFSFFFWPRFD